ncbi:MAG TPA: hypothetical protein VMS18_14815 [Candidatus Binatia bacterium]|nr:hypothetical protein [Candidatus Binatia bacterium]
MAAFRLSKWYLDYVTDSGNASIAYVGDLQWGPISLHYSSLLRSTGSDVKQRNSLRHGNLPEMSGNQISWDASQFNFTAAWQADSREVREAVFANEEGSVDWHCLIPCGLANAGNDSGLGYVEHLTMTVAPWKIPIKDLRWGRFGSATDWAVWIDWQGEYLNKIVYLNGKRASAAQIGDDEITFDDGSSLTMDRSLILRSGPLGTTALSSIPGVNKTFPARLLQVNECKWRSRARLICPGRSAVEGWAIHEIVSWPR